jgi:nucleoside-diphosphate-sugar epimerase
MKILITGALGWTAEAISEKLANHGHYLLGLDIVPPRSNLHFAELYQGSVTDEVLLKHLMHQVEAVLHLAVAIGTEDYLSSAIPFETNVRGTYLIFESARQAGVAKIVLLSSAPIHMTFSPETIVDARTPLRSSADGDHLYDLTKHLQEQIAQDYAQTFGMQVMTLRAGHIVNGRTHLTSKGQPLAEVDYCRGGWVCRYDLATAVQQTITLNWTGYEALHVISDSRASQCFGLERTRERLDMDFAVDFSIYPF